MMYDFYTCDMSLI